MRRLIVAVDRLLRGGYTAPESLQRGEVSLPVRTPLLAGLLLGTLYGVFMGLFGALRVENPAPMQILASTLKVPLVFLLTLVVTGPSLYVWSALAQSRLSSINTLKLLLVGVVVNLALLSSFGPPTYRSCV